MLIYPKWTMFDDEKKQFDLGNGLTIDVFPFDLTDPITSANRIIERFQLCPIKTI